MPSLAGIPMICPVILGNQSKMEVLYQEKEFVAGRMSGNEQLGNNSRETRGASKRITAALALLCRCTTASALGHLHSPRVEKRLAFISRHVPCNKKISWYKS